MVYVLSGSISPIVQVFPHYVLALCCIVYSHTLSIIITILLPMIDVLYTLLCRIFTYLIEQGGVVFFHYFLQTLGRPR